MTTTRVSTMLLLSAATGLSGASALADCPVVLKHPEKIPFAVTNSLTSDVNLTNTDEDACNSTFVKQVPIWNDGTFSYVTDCDATSYGDGYDEGQPISWADTESSGGMNGRILDNGFQMNVVLDGYVTAYNGSTSVDADLNAAYRFTLEDDARYTFVSFYHIDEGTDCDLSVQIVDIGRGLTFDWTDHFVEGGEHAEHIAAGTYEIRTQITYHQDGCDNFIFLAASEVEMRFYCDYFYRIGDINKDDIVNGSDLAILLAAFNSSDSESDLNGDGKVDGSDLAYLLADWG